MNVVEKEITDRQGRTFVWKGLGNGALGTFKEIADQDKRDLGQAMMGVKTLEMREDDVMICTYPRAGTHWIWEIASMVMKESAQHTEHPKERYMLEAQLPDQLAQLPSPRVLNGHQLPFLLPMQVSTKKVKVIHVYRNPKDVAVSLFHFAKTLPFLLPCMKIKPFETFSEFLPYFTGEYGVCFLMSIFGYYKEMEKFIKSRPEHSLNLCYEDMKMDPVAAVEQVAKFLDKDLSKDLIAEIAEKCSFKNLSSADVNEKVKQNFTLPTVIATGEIESKLHYRKGEVGDWKNYFTVAENEQFDKILEEQFKDLDWKFTYSL